MTSWLFLGLACTPSGSESGAPTSDWLGNTETGNTETGSTETGDSESDDDTAEPAAGDPFAPQPDESEGLRNVSTSLDDILEHGALEGACDAWRADKTDRRKELLCGKWMFFYESFGTAGVPRSLVEFQALGFPAELGYGFSELGMIEDPDSLTHMPIGLAEAAPMGTVKTLAFTCASCHFAQLDDGRYAVGAPNHNLDYGAVNLHLVLMPMLAMPGTDLSQHDAGAVAVVQPALDRLSADPMLQLGLLAVFIDLLGAGSVPTFSKESEGHYADWAPGTMDFLIEPLPLDDGVHTVSRIPPLWGIPTDEEARAAGMTDAMLGWTGNTPTLTRFAQLFGEMGGGTAASEAEVQPLVRYIESLRAPDSATENEEGRAIFQADCASCHGGPRGSGLRVYDFDEIGTDDAMRYWMDPDGDGDACCGVDDLPITNGIKSPRLVGLGAQKSFLHNGSVPSLEALLCLGTDRPTTTAEAYGDQGHLFGCELDRDEKTALIAYLLAH